MRSFECQAPNSPFPPGQHSTAHLRDIARFRHRATTTPNTAAAAAAAGTRKRVRMERWILTREFQFALSFYTRKLPTVLVASACSKCAIPTGSGQACRNQCATASLADWFECIVIYVALHEGAARLFALTTSRFINSGKPGILGNQRGRGYG